MSRLMPRPYWARNERRAAPSIGARRTRAASSSAFGGGSAARKNTDTKRSGRNSAPVAAGIQNGLTCQSSISHLPTDLTAPEETMKLAQTTAPSTSDVRRPSMNPNTSPQIMPSGRPFRNIAATFHGGGTIAKSTSETPASRMSTMIAVARRAGCSSEIILMPSIFESAYPATCAITSAIL